MKIDQDKEGFKPITITLETKAEAEAFWAILRHDITYGPRTVLACNLSDWFSTEAKL